MPFDGWESGHIIIASRLEGPAHGSAVTACWPFTATHFSLVGLLSTGVEAPDSPVSSSEVTLSSVSASAPALPSDVSSVSELALDESPESETSASPSFTGVTGVEASEAAAAAAASALAAVSARRLFLALARASLRSSRYKD